MTPPPITHGNAPLSPKAAFQALERIRTRAGATAIQLARRTDGTPVLRVGAVEDAEGPTLRRIGLDSPFHAEDLARIADVIDLAYADANGQVGILPGGCLFRQESDVLQRWAPCTLRVQNKALLNVLALLPPTCSTATSFFTPLTTTLLLPTPSPSRHLRMETLRIAAAIGLSPLSETVQRLAACPLLLGVFDVRILVFAWTPEERILGSTRFA